MLPGALAPHDRVGANATIAQFFRQCGPNTQELREFAITENSHIRIPDGPEGTNSEANRLVLGAFLFSLTDDTAPVDLDQCKVLTLPRGWHARCVCRPLSRPRFNVQRLRHSSGTTWLSVQDFTRRL